MRLAKEEWLEALGSRGLVKMELTEEQEDEIIRSHFGEEHVSVLEDGRQRRWYELAATEIALVEKMAGSQETVTIGPTQFLQALYQTGCIPPGKCYFFSKLREGKADVNLRVVLPLGDEVEETSLEDKAGEASDVLKAIRVAREELRKEFDERQLTTQL